eukprot:1160987-Pelagomonas_calceolata.AAC.3
MPMWVEYPSPTYDLIWLTSHSRADRPGTGASQRTGTAYWMNGQNMCLHRGMQVDEETYAKMVEHINTNRIRDGDVDARSVTEALAALGITDSAAEDKNPEK